MSSLASTPESLPALTDELLEEIFLRLPTPAALARSSTACASFRRIITGHSFLRRFRARHPPPLLGFVDGDGFQPAQAPHRSAPLARALDSAADFSYSFVPMPEESDFTFWSPRDVRDGRILLEWSSEHHASGMISSFPDLAVCDPVYRRYMLLPRIPEDRTARQGLVLAFVPMLAPSSEEGDETSFEVICRAHIKTNLVAFVFSSVTRKWRIAASPTWSSLGTFEQDWCTGLSSFNCVRGCFYWVTDFSNILLLDTRKMEFTIVKHNRLPPHILVGRHGPRALGNPPFLVVGREGALQKLSPQWSLSHHYAKRWCHSRKLAAREYYAVAQPV